MLSPHNVQVVILAPVHASEQLSVVLNAVSFKPTLRCPAELSDFAPDCKFTRVNYVLTNPDDFVARRHRAICMVRDAVYALRRRPGTRLAIVNVGTVGSNAEFAAVLRYLDNRDIGYDVISI